MVQPVAKMSITELMKLTLKMGLECNFETVANMGPSHRRMFVMCCIVGDIIAQGSGCGKNKAKHEAARMALNISSKNLNFMLTLLNVSFWT